MAKDYRSEKCTCGQREAAAELAHLRAKLEACKTAVLCVLADAEHKGYTTADTLNLCQEAARAALDLPPESETK
jgi:hypothetical protein